MDGETSDRSLFASFNKAVKTKLPEEGKPSASQDDDFDKNVQAFLDEQNDKVRFRPNFSCIWGHFFGLC